MELIRYSYREALEPDELAFLQKKERKDRKLYYTVIKWVMILCFLCPFVVAWFHAVDGAEDPFSYKSYFIGVGFLLFFTGTSTYIVYHYSLRRIQSDIRHRTKTIERAHIVRKQFMPHNNTYHFYIDSPNKLSIEVTAIDFHRLDSGDELSIEYTTYSKMYLGYF